MNHLPSTKKLNGVSCANPVLDDVGSTAFTLDMFRRFFLMSSLLLAASASAQVKVIKQEAHGL
jgi:hypothetical protein